MLDPKLNQLSTKCTPFHQRDCARKLSTILTREWDLIAKTLDLKAVSRENLGHNHQTLVFPSPPVTCCDLPLFLWYFEVYSTDSSKMIGYPPAGLRFTSSKPRGSWFHLEECSDLSESKEIHDSLDIFSFILKSEVMCHDTLNL